MASATTRDRENVIPMPWAGASRCRVCARASKWLARELASMRKTRVFVGMAERPDPKIPADQSAAPQEGHLAPRRAQRQPAIDRVTGSKVQAA